MKTKTQSRTKIEQFPEYEIRESIASWWEEEEERRKKDPFSGLQAEGTLHEVLPEMDSLSLLDFLITIESVFDRKIPSKLIRRGGYSSSEDMLDDLVPKLREFFENIRS